MDLLAVSHHWWTINRGGHILDDDNDLLWSTHWCGGQIAALSLSYHRHLLARRICCSALLTINSSLCFQPGLFERSLWQSSYHELLRSSSSRLSEDVHIHDCLTHLQWKNKNTHRLPIRINVWIDKQMYIDKEMYINKHIRAHIRCHTGEWRRVNRLQTVKVNARLQSGCYKLHQHKSIHTEHFSSRKETYIMSLLTQ